MSFARKFVKVFFLFACSKRRPWAKCVFETEKCYHKTYENFSDATKSGKSQR
jgi:hypothetical protein